MLTRMFGSSKALFKFRAEGGSLARSIARPSFTSFKSFSTDKDSEVPDDFFDEQVEAEKEMCDVAMSLIHDRGLEAINSIKENYSWNDLSKFSNLNLRDPSAPQVNENRKDPNFLAFLETVKKYKSSMQGESSPDKELRIQQLKNELTEQIKNIQNSSESFSSEELEDWNVYDEEEESDSEYDEEESEEDSEYETDKNDVSHLLKESKRKPFVPGISAACRVDEDPDEVLDRTLGEDQSLRHQLGHLQDRMFYRPHDMNIKNDDDGVAQDRATNAFIKDTDPTKFPDDQQGRRHCPGKLQRRGKSLDAPLGCHLIDLDTVSPIDLIGLKRFLSLDAEILGKKHTGLCSKCQRKVARTVKQARSMGLLPHIGLLKLGDANPRGINKPFHDVVAGGGKKNKPIMSNMVPVN